MSSPLQRISNDSTVTMLAIAAGAVLSTRIPPASALNTLCNSDYFCVFK